MVIHDLNLAWQACDHWLLLYGGGDWVAGRREQIADPTLLRRAFGPQLEVVAGPSGPLFLTRLRPAE
jgi:iron complex transport system ATP-binding protein